MSTAMADTATNVHQWVKYTKTGVAAVPDPDNDNEVFLIEDLTPDEADAQAVYGCENCGISMHEGYETVCPGPSDG